MKRALPLLLTCLSWAQATSAPTPLELPAVSVRAAAPDALVAVPSAPLVFEVARTVLVQPDRLETRLQPGYTTGTLAFTLFSQVNTAVQVVSDDPRLVIRGAADIQLAAYNLVSVNAVALEAHSGTLRILNSRQEVIARVPYVIASAKTVSQGLSLNYTPSSTRMGLNYSVGGLSSSVLDPQWNIGVGLGVSTDTGKVNGGVTIGVYW